MRKVFILCLSITILSIACTESPVINVTRLRCEQLSDPVGIDRVSPALSWEIVCADRDIHQVSYRILVASSLEKLNADNGDLWDSQDVNSDESVYIPYNGRKPESRSVYFWKVKVTTNKGASQWSDPAQWSMGLMNQSDWKAQWTGLDKSFPGDVTEGKTRLSARYFRKEFDLDKEIRKADLYVSGLGFYEAYINGTRIGTQVLSPTPTDYSKVVKYNTFDVTRQVLSGKNAIGISLGNGRYFSMRPPHVRHFGFPKMILQLEVEFTDGSRQVVVSDDTWKVTANGPIRTNNEFDGEEYDARMEMPGWNKAGFDDSLWEKAEQVSAPEGKLEAQINRNIKVMEVIRPVSISESGNGKYIMDMGQNMVGWLRMKVKGNKGDQVQLRFAEILKDDGSIYLDNIRSALVTDKYTLKGGETESWEPAFTYHGFRFVEITGFPGKPATGDFEGMVVYDEMDVTGHFETSDKTINQIYKNAYWGIRGNYRGMPTD